MRFLNKDLKTIYGQRYWDNWNVYIIRLEQLHESSVSLKTALGNHLNLCKVITQFHGYYEVWNDNVQQQFVYFIVAICCNTLKGFLSQFL